MKLELHLFFLAVMIKKIGEFLIFRYVYMRKKQKFKMIFKKIGEKDSQKYVKQVNFHE